MFTPDCSIAKPSKTSVQQSIQPIWLERRHGMGVLLVTINAPGVTAYDVTPFQLPGHPDGAAPSGSLLANPESVGQA